jgi:hypothetical protein
MENNPPSRKPVRIFSQEAKQELARAAHLAKMGKRHNNMQDDSGSSDGEPRDDVPLRRHHPKFNSQHPANRDQL